MNLAKFCLFCSCFQSLLEYVDSAERVCAGYAQQITIALVTDSLLNADVIAAYNLTGVKDAYGRSTGDVGLREIVTTDLTKCLELKSEVVELSSNYKGLTDVYDNTVAAVLQRSQILVGDYEPSLVNYANQNEKFYFSVSPLPLSVESETNRSLYFVSTWPSQSLFLAAVKNNIFQLLMNKKDKSVIVLYHTQTLQGIDYVDALIKNLAAQSRLDTYDLAREVAKFKDKPSTDHSQSDGYYSYFKQIRTRLTMTKYQLVVLYLDLPRTEKLDILSAIFAEESELEERGTDWLLADMIFPFQHNARALVRRYTITGPLFYYITWNSQSDNFDECDTDLDIENVALLHLSKMFEMMFSKSPPGELTTHLQREVTRMWSLNPLVLEKNRGTLEVLNYPKECTFVLYERTPDRPDLAVCGNVRTIFTSSSKISSIKNILPNADFTFSGDNGYALAVVPIATKILRLVVVPEQPFVIQKADGTWTGLIMDIYYEVERMLLLEGIKLKLNIEVATEYGTKVDGVWNGVMGILNNRNDTVLALGQITATSERREDFDFTIPIGFSYQSYIFRKRVLEGNFFNFLAPFTTAVWLALGTVMVISGLYLYVMDQWNPFKNDIPDDAKFSCGEGLWHSFGVVTQGGAPFGASAFPNRVYSVFYWFFALVVVGCYTGNLANYLVESAVYTPEISIDDLPDSDYRYGMLPNTSVTALFESNPKMRAILSKVVERNDFVISYEEGLKRVRNENYILFGTSLVLRYHHNHDADCMLSMDEPDSYAGGRISEIAFPMRRDWIYKDRFKRAMENLRETGQLQVLYRKWIDSSNNCEGDENDDSHLSLGWENFIGLYILLVVGAVVSYSILAFKLTHLRFKQKFPAVDGKTEETGDTEAENVELDTTV